MHGCLYWKMECKYSKRMPCHFSLFENLPERGLDDGNVVQSCHVLCLANLCLTQSMIFYLGDAL